MPHARTRVNAQLTAQRRVLLRALGATGLITIVPARAQQTGKVWRIGILLPRARPAVIDADPAYRALAHGLRDLGYIDGKNASYQWKFAGGRYEQRSLIASETLKQRMPTMFWNKDGVDSGGLMSYGSNNADDFRRASRFADRILKGTHPRDLPVEQPIKFEFAINRKTATALGLKIPQELLLRADEVIE